MLRKCNIKLKTGLHKRISFAYGKINFRNWILKCAKVLLRRFFTKKQIANFISKVQQKPIVPK